jgi:hypothetical protein
LSERERVKLNYRKSCRQMRHEVVLSRKQNKLASHLNR